MYDFDFEEKTKEQQEKERYEKIDSKNAKMAKKIMTIVFCCLGGLYLVIGVTALIITEDEAGSIVGYVFGGLGILFIFLGILLHFVIPEKGNYERYKKVGSNFGYGNVYSMATRLEMLAEENRQLEQRVEELERKVRDLEGR